MASRRSSESKSSRKTKPADVPGEPAAGAAAAPAPRKKAAAKRDVVTRPVITDDMRRGMIAEAAYLRAERRGFAPGQEDEDWLAAEAEVDKLLSADQRAPQ